LLSDKRRTPQIDVLEPSQQAKELDTLAIDERNIGQIEHDDLVRRPLGEGTFELADPRSRQSPNCSHRRFANRVVKSLDSQHVVVPLPSMKAMGLPHKA
jgi:hypothetical protein